MYQNLYITMCCMSFLHCSLFFCYTCSVNLYFGQAALHYIINNILLYLILYAYLSHVQTAVLTLLLFV